MSIEVNKAFVQQFSDNIILLSQQRGSKLLDLVMQKPITGKYAHFDRIGAVEAREKTSRHSQVVRSDTPHSRRRVAIKDFYAADMVDKEDDIRMLVDPRNVYAQNIAYALGRKIDDIILEALTGNAASIDADDASSNIALPSSQIVTEDFGTADSNLTLKKLIEAKRLLDKNDVMDEERIIVVNASAVANLLNDTTITSADYNSVKALVAGEINTFLGFRFVMCNRLRGTADGTDTDPVQVVAFLRSAVGFALGQNVQVRMDELPDYHYSTQVYASMTGGAVRIEEEKVVKIECVQS